VIFHFLRLAKIKRAEALSKPRSLGPLLVLHVYFLMGVSHGGMTKSLEPRAIPFLFSSSLRLTLIQYLWCVGVCKALKSGALHWDGWECLGGAKRSSLKFEKLGAVGRNFFFLLKHIVDTRCYLVSSVQHSDLTSPYVMLCSPQASVATICHQTTLLQ